MLVSPERACFVITDLSGYTGYLTGTELDHAQDVLADLLETTLGVLSPLLRLDKLEGDAAFLYAPEAAIDGSTLLDALESAYFTFRRRLRSIRQATTCQCNACRTIPTLNLKFVAHHGAFVRQRIMGREELAGRDVILVHRMLKNAVSARYRLHGYALLTAVCVTTMGLDPAALGLQPHIETYEHIGEIPAFIHDLERRWRQEEETRRIRVTPEEADVHYVFDLPAPVPVVWDWNTDPSRRTQWVEDVVRVDMNTQGGRRGVGMTTHCVHGRDAHIEEIVDWHPFDYLSYVVRHPITGESLVTEVHEPIPGGTRLHFIMRVTSPEMRAMMADPEHRAKFEQFGREMQERYARSVARLVEILQAQLADRQADLAAVAEAREQLKATAAHYWQTPENWVPGPAPG